MKSAAAVSKASEKAICATTSGLRGKKTPATPDYIFAGLLFQISDDRAAREFQRRSEREAHCADHAETECHCQNWQAWSAIPDDVKWHQEADRACEQPGAPNAQH